MKKVLTQVLDHLLCIVSQPSRFPLCYTIAFTLRPHTLPQLVYWVCQSEARGYTGSIRQSKAGSAEEAASNGPTEMCRQQAVSARGFTPGSGAQAAEVGRLTAPLVSEQP